jgi:hypothetical protein
LFEVDRCTVYAYITDCPCLLLVLMSVVEFRERCDRQHNTRQVVSPLISSLEDLPFDLQNVLLLSANQVLQIPVGRARPPLASASGRCGEEMKVIIT